jgi:Holliday junction resolvase RusA-like endonuclease
VRVGSGVRVIDPPKSRSWKGVAQVHVLAALGPFPRPLFPDGPVELTVRAYWALPRSRWRLKAPVPARWRPQRPDGSNVLKACEDALNGLLYSDDSQVVRAVVETWTAGQGQAPCVKIEAREIGEATT